MTAPGPRRLARKLLPAGKAGRNWVRPIARLIEASARFGYLARGLVYLSIGAIALLAAVGAAPRAEGPVGALQAWAVWAPGLVLLWITCVGLLIFASWRAMQAFLDADGVGDSKLGLIKRAGKALSGIVTLALGLSILTLLDALGDAREVDDQAATQDAVSQALSIPGGGPFLIILGAGIFVAGAVQIIGAFGGHFTDTLDCSARQAAATGTLARVGAVARGIGFASVGALTGLAGWDAKADQARGLGGAFETLKDGPWGHLALGLLAAGFLAYGCSVLLKAGLRRIGC